MLGCSPETTNHPRESKPSLRCSRGISVIVEMIAEEALRPGLFRLSLLSMYLKTRVLVWQVAASLHGKHPRKDVCEGSVTRSGAEKWAPGFLCACPQAIRIHALCPVRHQAQLSAVDNAAAVWVLGAYPRLGSCPAPVPLSLISVAVARIRTCPRPHQQDCDMS
jgi:hypothetical protein